MNRRLSANTRRLVLGTAFAAALAAWLIPQPSPVRAATTQTETIIVQTGPKPAPETKAPAPRDTAKSADAPPADAKPDADSDEGKDAAKDEASGADITIDHRGIRVDKGRKHMHVQGFGSDREYDSFESFVQDAPWLAGLVFLVVLLVFLVPLLIIVLLLWYKWRKTRMLNETMLKLAEKGVVPPAEAVEALNANRMPSGPSTAPLYEQVKQIRQRAAASDLRKGIILSAVGLAFSAYSMLGSGEPNILGLVLLFLGIGYCLLWYFEERNPAPGTGSTPPQGGA